MVQRLTSELEHAPEKVALALILGVDGQLNRTTARAINWCIFGLSGADLDHPEKGCASDVFEGEAVDALPSQTKPYFALSPSVSQIRVSHCACC